jgi:hypothetical protein
MSQNNLLSESTLRKILNTTYFKVNSEFIANEEEISEYEIQYSFFDVLKNELKNKGFIVKKEKKRVDITISDRDETIKYCFEVKSYIKSHEKIAISEINKDITDLEVFLSEKDVLEKRAFVLLAIREKTLQTSNSKNKDLANYLNHKSKATPLIINKGYQHHLTSSYTIAHNTSIVKKSNGNQVRLFLIEILKTRK